MTANRKEYMRELMRKKRAANKKSVSKQEAGVTKTDGVTEEVLPKVQPEAKSKPTIEEKPMSLEKHGDISWIPMTDELDKLFTKSGGSYHRMSPKKAKDGKWYVVVKRRMIWVKTDMGLMPEVEHGVLSLEDYEAQLERKCPHGKRGFSHGCL